MAKKKARRPPRKKATNLAQAQQQLTRYDRLLNTWVSKMVVVAKRIEFYKNKTAYYNQRVADLSAADRQRLEQELADERTRLDQALADAASAAGRQHRAIDLPEEG